MLTSLPRIRESVVDPLVLETTLMESARMNESFSRRAWRLFGRARPSKAARSKAKRREQGLGPGLTWTVAQAAMRNPQSVGLARLRNLKFKAPTKIAPPTAFPIS